MAHGKVRAISSARLRLDPQVLRQAEGLARSAGVSVAELIELLLIGVLDMETGQVMPPPRRDQGPKPRVAPRQRARVLFMDDFRQRRAGPLRPEAPGPSSREIRHRASGVCRRAEQIRARSVRAREAAGRARETARLALEELGRFLA